jgi:hypothetical protein
MSDNPPPADATASDSLRSFLDLVGAVQRSAGEIAQQWTAGTPLAEIAEARLRLRDPVQALDGLRQEAVARLHQIDGGSLSAAVERIDRILETSRRLQEWDEAMLLGLRIADSRGGSPAAVAAQRDSLLKGTFLHRWSDLDTELRDLLNRLDALLHAARPASGETARSRRMTREAANQQAMELAKKDRFFVQRSLREWAEAIGCSEGLANELPFWRETMRLTGRGRKDATPAPKVGSLTKKLEDVTGEGERDEELNRLIAEQERDREPSPLDDDPPDSPPRKVRRRKRL